MIAYFITHPEVTIDANKAIDQWGLSDHGRQRAARIPMIFNGSVDAIVASGEAKAIETAEIVAKELQVNVDSDPALGEMNRSSTGYLPPDEFEVVVETFFSNPERSVRGWERAVDAQSRVVAAVRRGIDGTHGSIAFVAHGGVGALLLADLLGEPIGRRFDQPALGSYFTFEPDNWRALSEWHPIP